MTDDEYRMVASEAAEMAAEIEEWKSRALVAEAKLSEMGALTPYELAAQRARAEADITHILRRDYPEGHARWVGQRAARRRRSEVMGR